MRLHRSIVLSLAAAVAALPAARAADDQKTVRGSIQEVRAAAH